MSSLYTIDQYSQDQLTSASNACPAISRYLNFLKTTPNDFDDVIRLERHELWLRSALAVYFGQHSAEAICKFWSESADHLIIKVWNHLELEKEDLGLFALGKLGSMELNLSSDVDLIVLGSPENPIDVTKRLREFKRILNNSSSLGYALRVDFDLRPDGAWGPLIISIPHFQDHYWSRGETWERLALIRLRNIVGPKPLVENVFDLANRFCYRKYLDFTLMEDLKSLRSRIHAKAIKSPKNRLDLKLCIGGIRDAELFIHSLQVIHGGRAPGLRTGSTSLASQRLANSRPDLKNSLDTLLQLYWKMRDLENKVQIYCDEQTHFLKEEGPYPSPPIDFWKFAHRYTREIDQIVSSLLGTLDHSTNRLPKSLDSQSEWLSNLGFSNVSVKNIWPEIIKNSALSYKKDRDENARKDFLFTFVNALGDQAGDKDLALSVFLDFIKSVRAKSTLFNLILRNEKLLKKLVTLFSHSPYMGQIIASRPELIDCFLYGLQELSEDTEETLQLLFEKRQLAEIHGAIDFFDHPDPMAISHSLTSTADEVALSLRELVLKEVKGSDFDIICLGKWGSKEMGFKSDLDFVMVKNGTIATEDHRAAKRFINYMTSSQRGGKIYEIDMRLRPSGSAGPLLVSVDSLKKYLENRAQVWERQSYLKMRPLTSIPAFAENFLVKKPLSDEDLKELSRIRKKLIRKSTDDVLDLKYAPGGLIEIEFAIQTGILKLQIPSTEGSTPHLLSLLAKSNEPWRNSAPLIGEIYLKLRSWEQLLRLSTQSSATTLNLGNDTARRISTHTNLEPKAFFQSVTELLSQSSRILKNLDPIYTQD